MGGIIPNPEKNGGLGIENYLQIGDFMGLSGVESIEWKYHRRYIEPNPIWACRNMEYTSKLLFCKENYDKPLCSGSSYPTGTDIQLGR